MYFSKFILIQLLLIAFALPAANAQVIDTIANWDGINVPWTALGVSTQTVPNPEQQGINPSAHCLQATTSNGAYDLIYNDLTTPVNFAEFPKYRIKILAPPSGGSVVFKFENSDNSSWVEIEKTPVPGQWDELEYDFTGVTASDYVRMVIFFDFLGTTSGNTWYLDDVLRTTEPGTGLTSNLPIVIINTFGTPIPDEPKIDGEMMIIDNGPGNLNNQYDPPNNYSGSIGIEIRGQSAQMFPKKAYSFETRDQSGENLNVSLLGMPEENDWILYAPYSDKSMLRNFTTFYLGSKLGVYCTRMAFCEVIENNNYKGVYILMEKIKKDDNRVKIAKLNPVDISGDELTGGYILRTDKIDPDFIYGIDGWKSFPSPPYPNAMKVTYQYYYPEPEDIMPEQKEYIQNYILDTENSLTSAYFTNPEVGYNYFLNTASFVDMMLLNEISKEVDGYRYSNYFYKEKDSDGGKLFAGPPWDYNLGYANVDYWETGVDISGWVYTEVLPNDAGRMFWWKRLMDDPYFRNLLKTRWEELRQENWSNENIIHTIDSVVSYIDAGQQRNYQRWPILGQYVWPNYNWQGNDYDDEVAFFKNWLLDRLAWLDDNIPGEILEPAAALSGEYPELTIDLSDDYFSRTILKNKYFVINNAPAGLEIDTVIYQNASQAKVYLKGLDSGSATISITIQAKVINTFNHLTTSESSIGLGIPNAQKTAVKVYTHDNIITVVNSRDDLAATMLEIINLTGQVVAQYQIPKQKIQRIHTRIPSGVYLCRLNMGKTLLTKRIVILH